MSSWAQRVAAGMGAALACTSIKPQQPLTLPTNTCPDDPCDAYGPASVDGASPADAMIPHATCTAGACVVQSDVPGDLLVLVAIPEGSVSGAGRTFAARLADLLKTKKPTIADSGPCSADCVFLPNLATLSGRYTVQASDANSLKSTLVNSSVSLPVHVTYRALWPPGATSAANDAFEQDLPIYPVAAQPVSLPVSTGNSPGFATYLQSAMSYERTILPDSPFDREFPPDVNVVFPTTGDVPLSLDSTTRTPPPAQTFPTFDLSRTDGNFDGWTVYLRDATTRRVISPIKSLSGTMTPDGGVVLPTSHHPVPSDALTNTELVVAPPLGTPLPAEIFSPPGLTRTVVYAASPAPATVRGTVVATDGQPVAADLTFEATATYAAQPMGVLPPTDGGAEAGGASNDAGMRSGPYQPQPNFEFVAQASAQPDPSGASSFQVQLPRGIYRVIARPRNPASQDPLLPIARALTIVGYDTGDGFSIDAGIASPDGAVPNPNILSLTVGVAPTVTGTATIADKRALAGATVEALPVGCPNAMGDPGTMPKDTPSCLPRTAQTKTGDDGSFSLTLDPGGYVLRVEPADGTRLPWVWRAFSISVSSSALPAFLIPAPIREHFQLADHDGNPIAYAIVHVFMMPAAGSAVEVARAITDGSGYVDLYLDPTLP